MRKLFSALVVPKQFDWVFLAWCAVLIVCPVVCVAICGLLDDSWPRQQFSLSPYSKYEIAAIGFVLGSLGSFCAWLVFGENAFRSRFLLGLIFLGSLLATIAFGMLCVGPDQWSRRTTVGIAALGLVVLASVVSSAILRVAWYRGLTLDLQKRLVLRPSGTSLIGIGMGIFCVIATWIVRRWIVDEAGSSQVIGFLLLYGIVPLVLFASPMSRTAKWLLILLLYGGLGIVVWSVNTPDFPEAWAWLSVHIGFSVGILLASSGWLVYFVRLDVDKSNRLGDMPFAPKIVKRLLCPSPLMAVVGLVVVLFVFKLFTTYNVKMIMDESWPIGSRQRLLIARLSNGWQNIPDTGDEEWDVFNGGNGWEINLANYRLDAGDLAAIKDFSGIQSIAFRNEGNQYAEIFDTLSTQPVTYVDVHDVRIDANFVAATTKLKSFPNLALFGVELLETDLDTLSQVPVLITLDLSKSKITAATIQRVAELSVLQSLDFSGTNVTVDMLEPLVEMQSLTELRLANTGIGDEIAAFAERAENLTIIDISNTPVRWQAFVKNSRKFKLVKTDVPLSAPAKIYFHSGIEIWVMGDQSTFPSFGKSRNRINQFEAPIGPQAHQGNWIEEFAQAVEKDDKGNIVGLDLTDVYLNADDLRTLAKLPSLKRLAISPGTIVLKWDTLIDGKFQVDMSVLENFRRLTHTRIKLDDRRSGSDYYAIFKNFQALLKNTGVLDLEIEFADDFLINYDVKIFEVIAGGEHVKRLTLRDGTGRFPIERILIREIPHLENLAVIQGPDNIASFDRIRERFLNTKSEFRIESNEAPWPRFLPYELYELD